MEFPYEENNGQTHYDGCFAKRHHHNCAVAMVYRLQDQLATIQRDTAERCAEVCRFPVDSNRIRKEFNL